MTNKPTRLHGLYILPISPQGLFRSHDRELGKVADTGGQTKYVIELAEPLIHHEDVERVDLFTRQIIDSKVDKDYAEAEDEILPGANIIRIPSA